jgi:hypothetical protein
MTRTDHKSLQLDASGAEDQHHRLRHVVKALDEMVWAITPPMLATIQEIVSNRLAGNRPDPLELEERLVDSHHGFEFAPLTIEYEVRGRGRGGGSTTGQIAVLPIYGVIMPRATLFSSMSGGTSVEQLMAAFDSAVNDPNITSILLDIDSPGGSSDLIAELGQKIYEARGSKPIAAVANTDAGSAACWIACQCDEVGVTPSGKIGSIGVYGTHQDISAALEMKGVKPTTIQYGEVQDRAAPVRAAQRRGEGLRAERRRLDGRDVHERRRAWPRRQRRDRPRQLRAGPHAHGEGRRQGRPRRSRRDV